MVWRPSPLHVVLHALTDDPEDRVDVYAHWELLDPPPLHYVTRDYDAEKGVTLARLWLIGYGGDAVSSRITDEI